MPLGSFGEQVIYRAGSLKNILFAWGLEFAPESFGKQVIYQVGLKNLPFAWGLASAPQEF